MSRLTRLIVPAGILLALALAAPAGADSVQVGSAGWKWGSPLPQGNTVRSIAFSGASGYAVGDFGTVLASDDSGATWRGLVSGTLENLREVQAIDANSLFAGGGCVGRRSDDGGKTFTRVAFTPVETNCRQPLAAAWFATEQIGYIVLADGTTIRTDNDGQSFASKTPIPGTGAAGGSAKPTDIVFTGADTGLAATTGGKVYRTTDAANTWTLAVDYGRTVQSFALAGTSVIAAGDQGLLRSSNDGGETWTRRRQGRDRRGQPLRRELRERAALRHDDGRGQRPARERPDPLRGTRGHVLGRTVDEPGDPVRDADRRRRIRRGVERRGSRQRRRDRAVGRRRQDLHAGGQQAPGLVQRGRRRTGEDGVRLRRQRRDRQDRQRRRGLVAGQRPDLGDAQRRLVPDARRGLRARRQRRALRHRRRRRHLAHARHRHHRDPALRARPDGRRPSSWPARAASGARSTAAPRSPRRRARSRRSR